jgi:hypothetical protein
MCCSECCHCDMPTNAEEEEKAPVADEAVESDLIPSLT